MSTLRNLGLAALAAAAFAGGCASEENSTFCPTTGIVCPEDTICAAAQPVCLVSSCGNGQIEAGEQCDDGNIIDGDRCSSLCRMETCGNGIQDVGEECDPMPGNAVSGDGCSENCTVEICGNSIVDVGEACDDGDAKNGDGCSGTSIMLPDGQGGMVSSPGPCESNEVCGNGTVDYQVGEVCDDGNVISEDGCNSDCRSGTGCGNGIRELEEECDDGNDTDTDRCLNDCTLSQCGDGVIEAGRETCDAGDRNNRGPVETAECNIDCTTSSCGDRRVNPTDGEECDAGVFGNGNSKNCTNDCLFNICGDGHKDEEVPNTEACDDGDDDNFNGCSNACQIASCGNSTIDVGEECDDGDDPMSPNNNDACVQCKIATCGDGWVRTGVEECDGDEAGQGDNVPGDGCFACKVERCGNNIVDFNEQCDDGQTPVVDPRSTTASPNSTAVENTDACINAVGIAVCLNARCGDGYLRNNEACDDGNNVDGDGCSATCLNEGCGNGVLETVRGEQCDDNNQMGGDGCSATCQLEDCGDGVVDVGEQCDGTGTMTTPGVGGETPTCNADCTTRSCGDGKINNAAMEQCDDGTVGGVNQNQNNRDCRADCRLNFCTDGFQNTAGSPAKREACDDGDQVNNNECSNSCQLASCGNGLLDTNEECDLGALNNDGGACTLGCKIAVCGDSLIRAGVEECDPGANALSANGPCLAGTGPTHVGGCRIARCGDGSIQTSAVPANNVGSINEACDSGVANVNPASPPNCPYGAQSCTFCAQATCSVLTFTGPTSSQTAWCGDGVTDALNGEVCDISDLNPNPRLRNGNTECEYNLTAGGCNLCNSTCTAVLPDRIHRCGDGVVDSGTTWGGNEMCDLGAANGTSPACPYGQTCARCSSDCSTATTATGPSCGDGIVNGTEQCDNASAGCSAQCTIQTGFVCPGNVCSSPCGDGIKASDETCDDGNVADGDGCNATCTAMDTTLFTCMLVGNKTECTRIPDCGDGFLSAGEMCDYGDADNNSLDCGPGMSGPAYGVSNACVACTNTCTSIISVDYCGDGSINGPEVCEAGNLNGQTCGDIGSFDNGTLACSAACTFDTSACTTCGNNIREGSEMCDNGGGGGDGCSVGCVEEQGFDCTGAVGQPSTCASDCGDGVIASNEGCDDGDNDPGDGCSATCTVETNFECTGAVMSTCGCVADAACPGAQYCTGSVGSPGSCAADLANGGTCSRPEMCVGGMCNSMVCAGP